MKFLVDNQLPEALARFLNERGHQAMHVLDLRLDEATDLQIWSHAAQNDSVLVSKDEDFLHLANRLGETGKLAWVRTGNCRKRVLLEAFERALPLVIQAFEEGYRVVEVR